MKQILSPRNINKITKNLLITYHSRMNKIKINIKYIKKNKREMIKIFNL